MKATKSGEVSKPVVRVGSPVGPEDETKVPCPVCRVGTVPPTVAQKVSELLASEGDGPASSVADDK